MGNSQSQNAIGIAVIGGMVGATFLAIFFVPMFFVLVEKVFHGKGEPAAAETQLRDLHQQGA